jgi:hypothetical protein
MPTRGEIVSALREAGGGDLVGVRALIDGAPDMPVFRAWFVAGTVGYVEIDRDGRTYLAGVWRPEVTYGM